MLEHSNDLNSNQSNGNGRSNNSNRGNNSAKSNSKQRKNKSNNGKQSKGSSSDNQVNGADGSGDSNARDSLHSRVNGRKNSNLPKMPPRPAPKDPFEDLSPEARRGLRKFLANDPKEGETNYLFLQKHGLIDGEDLSSSEAHMLVQSYAQQRMMAEHNVIPSLEQQIKGLEQERRVLERRIEAVRSTFGIPDLARPQATPARPKPKPRSMAELSLRQREDLRAAVKKVEHDLLSKVIGQSKAIEAVMKPLKRAVTGVADPNRPLSTLFFAGSTGIGKTLTADVLAESLKDVSDGAGFGYLTINCGEFQNKHEVSSRNLGAPPGYIGFDKGGLFDALKDNPFHVVLLDEIEKADPAFFRLLLQVLEKGETTMANGEKVSFKNAIIIMTSNVGTRDLQQALNPISLSQPESLDTAEVREIIDHALKNRFPPEFINRLDQKVYFEQLSKDDSKRIAGIEVQKVVDRVERAGNTVVEVRPEVYDFLVAKGYSNEYGARNMRRTVELYIQNTLSEALFDQTPELVANTEFILSVKDGKIVCEGKLRG